MGTEIFKVNGVTVANIKNKSNIAMFGIAVLAGSNYETPEIAGISHYAEHIFFKGTKTRNWRKINEEFALLGVNNNAFTNNNEVFYHTTCPKENISQVITLMTDMFFNSVYDREEIDKERNVIIEEKKMYEDDVRSSFFSGISNRFFDWDIGHDTIGTFETIKSINRENIMDYLKSKISLNNMIFICSGDIDSEDLKKYIEDNMPSKHSYLNNANINESPKGYWTDIINQPDKIKLLMERENVTQASVAMFTNNLSTSNPLYYHSIVIGEAIGGGLYSLLASRIREELGLCYSVCCFDQFLSYPDKRTFGIYGGTSVENVQKFIEESEKIMKDVAQKGLSKKIFECAKTDYLSHVLRSTETSAGLGMFMVKKLLFHKEGCLEDILAKIRSVNIDECNELAKDLLSNKFNWAVMIPKGSKI
jgi:predicted Zn-dependent peptidase